MSALSTEISASVRSPIDGSEILLSRIRAESDRLTTIHSAMGAVLGLGRYAHFRELCALEETVVRRLAVLQRTTLEASDADRTSNAVAHLMHAASERHASLVSEASVHLSELRCRTTRQLPGHARRSYATLSPSLVDTQA